MHANMYYHTPRLMSCPHWTAFHKKLRRWRITRHQECQYLPACKGHSAAGIPSCLQGSLCRCSRSQEQTPSQTTCHVKRVRIGVTGKNTTQSLCSKLGLKEIQSRPICAH